MVRRGSGLPRGTKRIRFRSAAPTVSSTSRQKREEVAQIAHPLRTPEGRLIAHAASDDRGLGAPQELPLAPSRLREQPLEVALAIEEPVVVAEDVELQRATACREECPDVRFVLRPGRRV